ncbi:MAG: DoxX family membrane protein [Gemmatimonadales bacterium]|nr:DoxX family membrane protein [Gemmatimonadales bacterium]
MSAGAGYRPRSPASMVNAREWVAVLRIVVGLYFVKSLITKMTVGLLGGFLPFPEVTQRWIHTMPKVVAKQAADNPILFFKHFLEGTVLTHPELFARLTAWGETAVGIGLTLGLLTGLASIVGMMLVLNYGLATQWMSPGQQGFHLVLFTLMLAFFFARAGRTWGFDRWFADHRPKSLLNRRPLS